MKSLLIFLTLLSARQVVATFQHSEIPSISAGCHEDNCFRGVAGVNGEPARSERLGDCEKLLRSTVTLAPTTTTVTVNITLAARHLLGSSRSVPTYATYCPNFSDYQSACSCAGITQGVTTTPQATITQTVTATFTPEPSCPGKTLCPKGCADLTQDNNNCGSCNNTCAPPFVCGQSKCVLPAIYSCSPPDYHSCGGTCGGACFADVVNGGWCKKALPCEGLKNCTSGADCDSSVCLVNNCGKVCAGTPFLCDDTAKVKGLFAKRDVGWESFGSRLEGRELIETEVGLVEG